MKTVEAHQRRTTLMTLTDTDNKAHDTQIHTIVIMSAQTYGS